jgi:hypothetical protein
MTKMMWLLALPALLLLSSTALSEQIMQFNISKGDPNVKQNNEACGDHGTCFWIDMNAPGKIISVDYDCEGSVCGFVHPCPSGGLCNLHVYEFEVLGPNSRRFWAWTNSGDPRATYKFTIHYE